MFEGVAAWIPVLRDDVLPGAGMMSGDFSVYLEFPDLETCILESSHSQKRLPARFRGAGGRFLCTFKWQKLEFSEIHVLAGSEMFQIQYWENIGPPVSKLPFFPFNVQVARKSGTQQDSAAVSLERGSPLLILAAVLVTQVLF